MRVSDDFSVLLISGSRIRTTNRRRGQSRNYRNADRADLAADSAPARCPSLCRCRHNDGHADVAVMPNLVLDHLRDRRMRHRRVGITSLVWLSRRHPVGEKEKHLTCAGAGITGVRVDAQFAGNIGEPSSTRDGYAEPARTGSAAPQGDPDRSQHNREVGMTVDMRGSTGRPLARMQRSVEVAPSPVSGGAPVAPQAGPKSQLDRDCALTPGMRYPPGNK